VSSIALEESFIAQMNADGQPANRREIASSACPNHPRAIGPDGDDDGPPVSMDSAREDRDRFRNRFFVGKPMIDLDEARQDVNPREPSKDPVPVQRFAPVITTTEFENRPVLSIMICFDPCESVFIVCFCLSYFMLSFLLLVGRVAGE